MSNKYCSDKCEISIPAAKIPAMKAALLAEAKKWGRDVNEDSSLTSLCNAFYWKISLDGYGNANHILAYNFLSYWGCDRERFLEVIAPFVDDGSFVEMCGEDDDIFHVGFMNGKTREVRPWIYWGD
jgi:hypothetical protein